MKRKLRQFPQLGNKRGRENARGAFKTTMHHNLQTEPWSLICSCMVIHLHQGCHLMLCSVSLCIFGEWQSRTDTLRVWLTVCFQISSLWRHSCRTWTPAWLAAPSRWRRSWLPQPQSLRAQHRGGYEFCTCIYNWRSLWKLPWKLKKWKIQLKIRSHLCIWRPNNTHFDTKSMISYSSILIMSKCISLKGTCQVQDLVTR